MTPRRTIGRTDLEVTSLCLGGNVFGWSIGEERAFSVLDAYVDAGGNFVDTANIYSYWAPGNRGGESETIIGRWMAARGHREDLVIATKVGMAGGAGQPRGLTREKIMNGVQQSLARLGIEHIDLYWAHEDDPQTPLEETMAAFDELVREGMVRWVGASNYGAARLAAALDVSARNGWTRYEALQPHYNVMDRAAFEDGLAGICRAHGLGVAPYFSLARGFLTGKYRPGGRLPPSPRAVGVARDYMNDRGWAVLGILDEIAVAHGATVGQVALAWLMAQDTVTAPIASATSPEQVRELMGATMLSLTEQERDRLSAATAAL